MTSSSRRTAAATGWRSAAVSSQNVFANVFGATYLGAAKVFVLPPGASASALLSAVEQLFLAGGVTAVQRPARECRRACTGACADRETADGFPSELVLVMTRFATSLEGKGYSCPDGESGASRSSPVAEPPALARAGGQRASLSARAWARTHGDLKGPRKHSSRL